jgi:hypothetical protein
VEAKEPGGRQWRCRGDEGRPQGGRTWRGPPPSRFRDPAGKMTGAEPEARNESLFSACGPRRNHQRSGNSADAYREFALDVSLTRAGFAGLFRRKRSAPVPAAPSPFDSLFLLDLCCGCVTPPLSLPSQGSF